MPGTSTRQTACRRLGQLSFPLRLLQVQRWADSGSPRGATRRSNSTFNCGSVSLRRLRPPPGLRSRELTSRSAPAFSGRQLGQPFAYRVRRHPRGVAHRTHTTQTIGTRFSRRPMPPRSLIQHRCKRPVLRFDLLYREYNLHSALERTPYNLSSYLCASPYWLIGRYSRPRPLNLGAFVAAATESARDQPCRSHDLPCASR